MPEFGVGLTYFSFQKVSQYHGYRLSYCSTLFFIVPYRDNKGLTNKDIMNKGPMLVLAMLFVFSYKSQTTWTLTIQDNGSSNACLGNDFSTILKFKYAGQFDTSKVFYFIYVADNLSYWNQFTFKATKIFDLPKFFNGTDTLYTFLINIPLSLPIGHYLIYAQPITGQVTQLAANVYVSACVGIEELLPANPAVNPIYYDLMGNVIEKRANELIVERVGVNRRKVIIQ